MSIKPLFNRVVLQVEEAKKKQRAVSFFHLPHRKSHSLQESLQ